MSGCVWQSRPFGLPARLHVAALARRRARVLGARSDRYLYTLYTVALFYSLPVLQFVAGYQIVSTVACRRRRHAGLRALVLTCSLRRC